MSQDALTELSTLSDLDELAIGHIPDFADAEPLSFLRSPSSIGINNCPISDLAGLNRWAHCLQSISLRGMQDLDLRSLAGLTNLAFLDIQGSTVRNLSMLGGLQNLATVWLTYDPATLAELPAITSLRDLGITGDVSVNGLDLTPLTGIRNVTIRTWRKVSVQGVQLLGLGSKLQRW